MTTTAEVGPARRGDEEFSAALREARFTIPVLRTTWLPRAHIAARIDRSHVRDRVPVTVVCAPLGAGKTSALAALARGRPRASTAWCTLDSEGEGEDAYRFGQSVLGAVLAARAATGSDAIGAAACSARDPLDAAVQLVADDESLFVFDNVERLDASLIATTLGRLVQHLPATASVVLLTDTEQSWTNMLGARADIRELHAPDLAFSPAEFAALLAARDIELPPARVANLTTWSGGIAAALNLAASAIGSGADADSWTSERCTIEALLGDVLGQLSEGTGAFLAQTSISTYMSAGLAAAVTGFSRPDAARELAMLADTGFFLAPVDGQPGYYRYDQYVREALRARAGADTSARANARAARWLAAAGAPAYALPAALAAEDWESATELIVDRWARARLDQVPAPLPQLRGCSESAAPVVAAIYAIESGDLQGAREHAAAIKHDNLSATSQLAAALVQYELAHNARGSEAIDDAADALDKWARQQSNGDELQNKATGTAMRVRAEARLVEGDVRSAIALLEESAAFGIALGDDAMTANATALLALVTAIAGRIRRASACVDELGATCVPVRSPAAEGARSLALAIVAYHDDRLAAAQSAIVEARALVAPGALSDTILPALRARIAKSLGAVTSADRILLRAATAGRPRLLAVLREGLELRSAPRFVELIPPGDLVTLMSTHPYTLVTDDLERSVLAHEGGDRHGMRRALERALGGIERNGYRRVGVDSHLPLQPVLSAYIAGDRPYRMLAAQLLERLDGCDRPGDRMTIETLTERELTVLRYLPTMLSNREIAAEMFFSVNTVKTHLKGIYRKLDVKRRRDAVERARALSLI